ncbi:uncharacterized protein I303_100470 [Kwoniella dejecticola CBS 10117]|uniref:1-acyl-sn-glycerol-3-phosphate acyltransferase n=1 Tax=Kwoniella dejecticola CBS 10117 TaxID=1296121 RepID=A0A1A6AF49_9TREE|nr:lysophosphatidate acyltransferase [Kwoniella dejecticola CBS 10117]OBR88653.1 lysophosphatidate acyltransferase [Kwoniella dejecticola CBS 10117]
MPLGWLLKPIALASTLAISTLGILSRKYQRARFYYHLTLYVSTLGALSVWGVIVSILATISGQRLNINYLVARSFYLTCSPAVGISFEVEGEEHLKGLLTARGGREQSAVLVGNHQSFLDILYLGRIFPKRAAIMAKKELKYTPGLGQFMSLSGAVFVNRSNRTDALAALQAAGEDMKKKGVSLWVFPEGTRSSSAEPALLPFKKGAFHLAVQAQVPIVPVVVENYHRLFDGRSRFESGSLKIKVLPPIPTIGLTASDVTQLSEDTREKMLSTLRDISEPGPSASRSPITASQTDTRQPEQSPETDGNLENEKKIVHLDIAQSSDTAKEEDMVSRSSKSGNDSTEDEMDDDAVLLKRPKSQATA